MRTAALFLALALTQAVTAHASETQIRPFEMGSFEQIRSAHAGKPFVVMLWATDCSYCKESMALLKGLKDHHPGLEVVTVATDPPEDANVARVLEKYDLDDAPAWAFAGDASWLRRDVDRKWKGEIPRTYFFDAEQRVTKVSGRLDPQTTQAWVETHLKK